MAVSRTVSRIPMLHTEAAVMLDTFRRLNRRHAKANLLKLINKTHPADLALLFRQFTDRERTPIFSLLRQTDRVGEFLSELDSSIIETLLEPLDATEVAQLLEEVGSDDAADILNLLPEEKASAVLETLKKEESEELEELMAYPEDTAGSCQWMYSLCRRVPRPAKLSNLFNHLKRRRWSFTST